MKIKIFLVVLMLLAMPAMSFAEGVRVGEPYPGSTLPRHPRTTDPAPTTSPSATATSTADVGAFAVIQSAPNYLQAQPVYPYLLQMIPGVIGDITNREELVDFALIEKYKKGDKVIGTVSYTRGGRIAGFTRIEDLETDIQDLIPIAMRELGQKDTSRMRLTVSFKMSSKSIGSGGGGGGSTAGFGGGTNPVAWGSNASIMPGVAVNTADPKFIIKFHLIAIPSVDYNKEGWNKVK